MEKGFQKINEDFYINKAKELGKGNFGKVYKGYYLSENKIIAIKFIQRQMLNSSPDYQRQLKVMSDLMKFKHPNIMDYYGYQEKKEGLYCFLEFCGGGSLKDFIARQHQISELKTLTLFRQLLEAMTYINEQNKVHRDIKPDNLLLDENEELKIADFGLARDVAIKMTKGACTPLYAAPEVMNQEPYDEKCDVWSCGLIMYEMLTGKEYFKHVKTRDQLLSELKQFSSNINKVKYPKQLHPQWERLTNMMLTFSPLRRKSFSEMLKIYKEVEPRIKEDIEKKYGYQTPGFQGFDDGVNLTKTMSPYQSKPHEKKGMVEKFQEEQSYSNLLNLRKFLTFNRLKADIMIRLVKEFTNNSYGCLKNIYKYILMFLSLSAFLAKISFHLKQIKNIKISTPDGQLSISDFTNEHKPELQKLLKDFTEKHETAMKKFEGVLQKQINHKILNTYMQREEQKKLVGQLSTTIGHDIHNMILETNKGHFQTQVDYMDIFRTLMNYPEVHITDNVLSSLNENDLKTYTFIRVVGNIDDIFLNGSYKQEDYLRMKKQDIENKQKEDLIAFTKRWNKNK